jgi:hypothetical protein
MEFREFLITFTLARANAGNFPGHPESVVQAGKQCWIAINRTAPAVTEVEVPCEHCGKTTDKCCD